MSKLRNFLAKDQVPKTLFGFLIVTSGYTEADLAFFREHPEAAGFYDEGDGEAEEQAAAKGGNTKSSKYDTALTKAEEAQYQKWRRGLPRPLQYEGDYDLRGYWKDPNTVKDNIVDGQHFTDQYKKPNHPTFSVESKYAVGEDRKRAGRWDGDTFIPPRGAYPGVSNNPGNVEKHERRTDKTLFDGEVGGGVRPQRFANFDDPVSGLNAAAAVLARRANGLAKEGKPFTIENYVPSYAPASENDTEGYIQNISKYSGFARNAELDRWDVDGMAKLLRTVVRFESGKPHSDWFTDEEYKAAAERLQEGAFD